MSISIGISMIISMSMITCMSMSTIMSKSIIKSMSNKPQNFVPGVSGCDKIHLYGPGRSGAFEPPSEGPEGQEMQNRGPSS